MKRKENGFTSLGHRVVERILLNPWILGISTEDDFLPEKKIHSVESVCHGGKVSAQKKSQRKKYVLLIIATSLLKSCTNC